MINFIKDISSSSGPVPIHFYEVSVRQQSRSLFCLKADNLVRKKFKDSDDLLMLSTYSQVYTCLKLNSSKIKQGWISYPVLSSGLGGQAFSWLSTYRWMEVVRASAGSAAALPCCQEQEDGYQPTKRTF